MDGRVGQDGITSRRLLGPVRSPVPWVAWGLIVQVLAVGTVAAAMWQSIRRRSLGGHITAEMIKFAWRGELHTRLGLIVLVAASVTYAAGSVIMARPFISRPLALFVAVPIAAVAGLLVFGVLVLVLALLFAALENADLPDFDLPGRRRRQRPRRS